MRHPRSKTAHWDDVFLDLLVIACFTSLVLYLVRGTGFSALSDDDYSRVVIAQRFVQQPHWDPSGTSWLPLPFLLTGMSMALFGPSLATAVLTQMALSVAGVGVVYAAARSFGAGRLGSVLGSLLCLMIPTAAFLAASAAPGFVTACLLTFAILGSIQKRNRLLCGLCFFLASASRYEAWAPSLVWGLLQVIDARSEYRDHRSAFPALLCATLAWLFPCVWMMHGVFHHGDALFFVQRVVDYKVALGNPLPSWAEVFSGYPRLLFIAEPALVYSTLFVSLAIGVSAILDDPGWQASDLGRFFLTRKARPFWLAFVLLCALTFGASRGGAPTHHPERALLSIWLCGAVLLGKMLERMLMRPRYPAVLIGAALLSILFSMTVLQGRDWERQGFARRGAEERIGDFIRTHAPEATIALAMADYGYFAVMAAAQDPSRFVVLEDNDPRAKLSGDDPLGTWLQKPRHCAYVTERDRRGLLPRVLAIEGEVMFAEKLDCTVVENDAALAQLRRAHPED